jgi:hypothetical protein
MKLINTFAALAALFVLSTGVALADADADTVKLFKNAGDSAEYFSRSAGYAVFPTIGKGGIGIGGAYGKGSVYEIKHRLGAFSTPTKQFDSRLLQRLPQHSVWRFGGRDGGEGGASQNARSVEQFNVVTAADVTRLVVVNRPRFQRLPQHSVWRGRACQLALDSV